MNLSSALRQRKAEDLDPQPPVSESYSPYVQLLHDTARLHERKIHRTAGTTT